MRSLKSLLAILVATVLVSCGGGGGCASGAECAATTATSTGSTSATVSPAASAVSVSIGTDGTIQTDAAENIKYAKVFAVTVSDASGFPVVGAKVTPKVEMLGFFKGRLFRDTSNKPLPGPAGSGVTDGIDNFTRVGPVVGCSAEDTNNNDIRDPGEDVNGDGQLTPARSLVVVTAVGSDVTNADGVVFLRAQYPKTHASWLAYRLIATAVVTGTEGIGLASVRASFAAGDDETVSTPFVFSPFGLTAACNSAN